jgi:hypothetical protein
MGEDAPSSRAPTRGEFQRLAEATGEPAPHPGWRSSVEAYGLRRALQQGSVAKASPRRAREYGLPLRIAARPAQNWVALDERADEAPGGA